MSSVEVSVGSGSAGGAGAACSRGGGGVVQNGPLISLVYKREPNFPSPNPLNYLNYIDMLF